MIAPEQWYQYQEQYQKYGLDMKPQESREHRERRRATARKTVGIELFAGRDRRALLILLLGMVMTMILFIVMTAYAASIRYDIGQVQRENELLWDEIKNLQSSETTMNGVGYVEEKAKKELGMVPADTEKCVYITSDDIPPAGFADVLKAKAYQ